MNKLRIRTASENQLVITGIPPLLVMCLRELPDILKQRNTPAVQKRLFPSLTDDDMKANEDWENLIVPELQHLFASAGETLAHDLATLKKESTKPSSFRVLLPATNLNAWISAINEARLILGELFDITEQDMQQEDFNSDNPKQFAVWKIGALGWLLSHMIEFTSGDSQD